MWSPLLLLSIACRSEGIKLPSSGVDSSGSINLYTDSDSAHTTDDSGTQADDSGTAPDDSTTTPDDSTPPDDSSPDSQDTSPPEPSDCIVDLPSADWNVLVTADFNGTGKVGGRLAGNTIDISDYEVAADDPGSIALAGDVISMANGLAYGDVVYGSSYVRAPDAGLTGTLSQGSPIDWAQMETDLQNLSTQLSAYPVNGLSTVQSWQEIDLLGTSADLNVFEVEAADISVAVKMVITVPSGAAAIVNINGDPLVFSDFAITLEGVDTEHLFFNAPDAQTIQIERFSFLGTLLAPQALVTFQDAHYLGQMAVHSLTGDGFIELARYDGELPCGY